jgi:hypothetical protein
MAKEEKKKRRRARSVTGLRNMNILASTVALWGPEVLARMPNSFDSYELGKGKPFYKNRRVLIIVVLIILCSMSDALKYKLLVIPLSALLTMEILQHNMTYLDAVYSESYPATEEGV